MMTTLAEENWSYYTGDHFPFWNGPQLPASHPKYQATQEEIKRIFRSYNICAEVVDTYVNALVGKPFSWSLKTDTGNNNSETEKLIQQWFEWQSETAIDQDLGDPLANAITQMLVRDQGEGAGVGYLRLYSPKAYSSLEPYQQIVLHAPSPGSIETTRNYDGILVKAVYYFGDNNEEVYTLLDNGLTKIESNQDGTKIVNYGGRLPIFELKGRALINEAVRRGQNAINKTLTIKDKNLESAGFLERVILGGQPPGKWVVDEEGRDRFIPLPDSLEIGVDKTAFIAGYPIGDAKAPAGYTNPGIVYREPVSIENFKESVELDIRTIYYQVGLAYLLSAGDGNISGKSRLSLKEDFLIRLRIYERIVEAMMRRVISVVLSILNDNKLSLVKPVVELNLAVSPLPEEREQNRADVETGIMSKSTAISSNGVDPQKELALIEAESGDLNDQDGQPN